MTKIGFIGLGTMGGPMARNVLKAGHSVTVYDLNGQAVQKLVADGAKAAPSPRACAEGAEIVITMLPDAPDVEKAVTGPDGILAGLTPGAIYIDMSTIDPSTTQRIGRQLAEAGFEMIDSPVGKTAEHAVAGTLTLMIGGKAETIARVEPVLRTMGTDLFHCGGLGMGQVMKLTNNLLASVLIAASAEALVGGVKAGLTLETMTSVLRTTMAWNQQLAVAMHNRGLKGNFEPGFMVKLAQKDCRLAMAMNEDLGLKAPVGAATLAALGELMDAGLAGLDVGAILKLREDAAGVTVRLAQ
jgi:4-hydroxybutyrate dehydrogenase/sulfolactaldehyde 3-reductase